MADLETNIQTSSDKTKRPPTTRAKGRHVVRLRDDTFTTGNVDITLPDSAEITINTWSLRDRAEETHDPALIGLLTEIAVLLGKSKKGRANAAKNGARMLEEHLRDLLNCLRDDETPRNAFIEIVDRGKYAITLRYNSGRSIRTRSRARWRFERNVSPDITLLDLNGEGIKLLIGAVKEIDLQAVFPGGEAISARKQEHLVRMLEDALAERRASTCN